MDIVIVTKFSICFPVTSADLSGLGLYSMEYVYVIVTLSHPNRGDLQMYLKCPSQSQSLIASTRTVDKYVEQRKIERIHIFKNKIYEYELVDYI